MSSSITSSLTTRGAGDSGGEGVGVTLDTLDPICVGGGGGGGVALGTGGLGVTLGALCGGVWYLGALGILLFLIGDADPGVGILDGLGICLGVTEGDLGTLTTGLGVQLILLVVVVLRVLTTTGLAILGPPVFKD